MNMIQMNDLAPLSVETPEVEQLSEYCALRDRIYDANTRISRLMLHARSNKMHTCSALRDLSTLQEQLHTLKTQAESFGRHL